MGAKKTAAGLTTAGVMFIAGCAGGGGGGHATLGGGNVPTSPQNAKNISLTFSIPRSAPAVLEMPAQRQPFGKHRRGAQSTTRVTPKVVRRPKYVSTATLNGSIGLYVYQGTQLASSQSFTVGFSNTDDFSCYFVPPIYSSLSCYNTVNIYVPGGSDTFYAATYDSQHRMLSVTPGLPGITAYGTAPAPISIPYSGAVFIQTYGIANSVTASSPTPCVNGFGTAFFFQDVDGAIVQGPLANPVTVNAGTFSILYAGSSVGSTYTFYSAPDPEFWGFASPGTLSGETGTLAATTSAGTLPVNFPAIYSVNETAFVASSTGLYALGLVNNSTTSYACGQVPMSLYNSSGTPVTFTNPVSMSQDGNDAIVVLDDAGTNPTVDIVLANDLIIAPSVYIPVVQTTLSSTGGLDITATPNLQAYILNTDGTIQRVDYSNAVNYAFAYGATNDGAIAGGLSAVAGSAVASLTDGNDDYVFASSANSSFVYEVDLANTGSYAGNSFSLSGASVPNASATFSPAVKTTAASSDDSNLYVSFRAFDTGISPSAAIVTCTFFASTPCLSDVQANTFSNNPDGIGTLATLSSVPALLVTDGNLIVGLYETNTANSFSFGTTFSPVATRIVTSPDSMWAGALQGSSFYFASTTTQTPVGSLSGAVSTIWGFPFF